VTNVNPRMEEEEGHSTWPIEHEARTGINSDKGVVRESRIAPEEKTRARPRCQSHPFAESLETTQEKKERSSTAGKGLWVGMGPKGQDNITTRRQK